jgi:hypothetical protein
LTANLQTIKTCKNNNPVQKSKEKINANNEHMVFGNKVWPTLHASSTAKQRQFLSVKD